jgi:hypothetical protein
MLSTTCGAIAGANIRLRISGMVFLNLLDCFVRCACLHFLQPGQTRTERGGQTNATNRLRGEF